MLESTAGELGLKMDDEFHTDCFEDINLILSALKINRVGQEAAGRYAGCHSTATR